MRYLEVASKVQIWWKCFHATGCPQRQKPIVFDVYTILPSCLPMCSTFPRQFSPLNGQKCPFPIWRGVCVTSVTALGSHMELSQQSSRQICGAGGENRLSPPPHHPTTLPLWQKQTSRLKLQTRRSQLSRKTRQFNVLSKCTEPWQIRARKDHQAIGQSARWWKMSLKEKRGSRLYCAITLFVRGRTVCLGTHSRWRSTQF